VDPANEETAMRLRFTNEETGESVTLDVEAGGNIWLGTDQGDDRIGSLFLDSAARTVGLGRYDEAIAWWEYENPLPVSATVGVTD
jgi:hypothetical protein